MTGGFSKKLKQAKTSTEKKKILENLEKYNNVLQNDQKRFMLVHLRSTNDPPFMIGGGPHQNESLDKKKKPVESYMYFIFV